MTLLIYNTAIWLYTLYLKFGAIFNKKARDLVSGRKTWRKDLLAIDFCNQSWIWFHCASLGEFEQGRPIIEEIKNKFPKHKIALTFFSPSGYTHRNKYEYADAVLYMPADTKANAVFFIEKVKPILAIFVKYEFWYHHISELHARQIKTILISAAFRKEQLFFKWHGGIFRKLLHYYHTLFVQDESSANLLKDIGVAGNVIIAGDTRYDRVAEIAGKVEKNETIEKFLAGSNALIAGSTWEADEKIIYECLNVIPENWKLIIAPHEITPGHLKFIEHLFGERMIFYSQLKSNSQNSGKRILVIDNIGLLSGLYTYGSIAYVGGGFQKGGIHNVLEPAIFGLPVIFGPVYKKFVEARDLIELDYAFPIADAAACKNVLNNLIRNEQEDQRLNQSIRQYSMSKTGATATIIQYLKQNNWI